MSRLQFSMLAAGVTVCGLVVVVTWVRVVDRLFSAHARQLAAAFLLVYGAALVFRPAAWPLIDLAVLTGAVGGVLWIERGLQTPDAVVAFLIVAAIVDLFSMSGGVSRAIVERYREGSSNVLLYLTLVGPVRGRAIPIVGIGDLLVGGAAAAALVRMHFRLAHVLGAVMLGLMCALAYGLWRGGAPAVPFIAVAVLVLVRQSKRRSARRERGESPA